MALLRPAAGSRECQLIGVDRKSSTHPQNDAPDPKRSLGAPVDVPVAYLIAAKASTCSRKSGLDNCAVGTVLLSGEGLPK
jgi:hypothetical protein